MLSLPGPLCAHLPSLPAHNRCSFCTYRKVTRFCSVLGARRKSLPFAQCSQCLQCLCTSWSFIKSFSWSWSVSYCCNSNQRSWSLKYKVQGCQSERWFSPCLLSVLCSEHIAHSQVQSSLCLHRTQQQSVKRDKTIKRSWSMWNVSYWLDEPSVPLSSLLQSHLHEVGREGTGY